VVLEEDLGQEKYCSFLYPEGDNPVAFLKAKLNRSQMPYTS